ncbi:MAG TPA: tannase/feruloyl esterase family alpha/beta hydrolase [Burkholderiaceae bacterium]|nr:tannase/feruloyl esterase family alpha/beta hydrolase [Burkholderiaceae bacterium]
MKRIPTFALALCAALSACQSTSSTAEKAPSANASAALESGGAKQCEALVGTRLGSGTIDKAEWIERGASLLTLAQRTMIRVATKGALQIDAPVDFCHVTATLRPVPTSAIKVGVWLPQPWNGKLLGSGGGGFNGGIGIGGFVFKEPLAQGYAGVATDAGHDETDSAKFAYDSVESLKDYGWRANHLGVGFAKALIASYYGSPAKRAYFNGCSNGGRDALMLAQRFPEDYDGIISGAPAADYTGVMAKFIWNRQAVNAAPKLKDKLKLVQDAVIAKCDALDGVKDGLLENPLRCSFDPAELQCRNGDGPNCLDAAEVTSLRKIHGGPRLGNGSQLYAGQPVGAEALPGGWDAWIIGEKLASLGPEAFRWMVYRDPKWDIDRFELARDSALAKERIGPIVDATNPDLSAFMRRGGKLMMYHGWNDVAIPAGATLDYYAALRKTVGPAADQQTRLFMMPGLLHCGGGPGATHFDKLGELDRWVESGKAPERIVATEYDPPASLFVMPNAKTVRTRPLCPWPKVAHFKGTGSSDDAANFICR